MNKENDVHDNEDVVVIEERDKHTFLYITLAAVLGIAVGGLIGSIVTKSKWETAYQKLEIHIERIKDEKAQVVVEVEEKAAQIDTEIEERLNKEISDLRAQHGKSMQESQDMITELEKVNLGLESEVNQLQIQIQESDKKIAELDRQADMQSIVIERSRELFHREVHVKQELAKLEQDREALIPKIERLKKECDIYLEGTSWDASKVACDKHDEANAQLSQTDQMIEVYKLDLLEIQKIADSVGI